MNSPSTKHVCSPSKSEPLQEVKPQNNLLEQSSKSTYLWGDGIVVSDQHFSQSSQVSKESHTPQHENKYYPLCLSASVDEMGENTIWGSRPSRVEPTAKEDIFPASGLLTRIFPERKMKVTPIEESALHDEDGSADAEFENAKQMVSQIVDESK